VKEEDTLWLATLSLTVFCTYLYHLYRAGRQWRRERSYRALRNFFIAIMLQVGLARIVLGAALRAFPDVQVLILANTVTAPILYVMLLSGGLVLALAWLADDRAAKRKP